MMVHPADPPLCLRSPSSGTGRRLPAGLFASVLLPVCLTLFTMIWNARFSYLIGVRLSWCCVFYCPDTSLLVVSLILAPSCNAHMYIAHSFLLLLAIVPSRLFVDVILTLIAYDGVVESLMVFFRTKIFFHHLC